MIKTTLSITLSFFSILTVYFFLPTDVQAQDVLGYRAICLKADHCWDMDCAVENNTPSGLEPFSSGHWAHITHQDTQSNRLEANSPFYYVECIRYPGGPACTTGNQTIDDTLGFVGGKSKLENDIEYEYQGWFKPSTREHHRQTPIEHTSNPDGTIPVMEMGSYNPHTSYPRYYQAVSLVLPSPPPAGVDPLGTGGHQQGTLQPRIEASTQNCESTVAWDPYGRSFDAISLEPINSTQVGLLQLVPSNLVEAWKSVSNPPPAGFPEFLNLSDLTQDNFSRNYANYFNPNISGNNPQPTDMGGNFSFIVQDGDYKLQPSKSGYNFLASNASQASLMSPRANTIYSDFYYANSPAIQQRGTIQHRDIPLFPSDGVGKTYPISQVPLYEETFAEGNTIVYKGKLSHPYAEVVANICSTTDGTQTCRPGGTVYTFTGYCLQTNAANCCNQNPNLCQVANAITKGNEGTIEGMQQSGSYVYRSGGADNEGSFTIRLDQTQLAPGEEFYIHFRKIDNLKNINLSSNPVQRTVSQIKRFISQFSFIKSVSAQESTTPRAIQPFPRYIEGYAYGKDGFLLPNAVISIYNDTQLVPVYQTAADENGFFRITSEFLPSTPYTIGITATQSDKRVAKTEADVVLLTTEFLSQNSEFIQAEDIDIYREVSRNTNPRRTVTPSFTPPNQVTPVAQDEANIDNTVEETTSVESQQRNNMVLVGVIFLLLLGTAGILLGIYIYKKRMREPEL